MELILVVGISFIAFGLCQLAFKDLWWWDHAMIWHAFGKIAERTEEWERSQDHLGYFCMASGVALLLYYFLLV